TLATLRRPSAIAVAPIAIGLVASIRHAHIHIEHPEGLLIFGIFYAGLYVTFPLSFAFNEKRQLFLAPSSRSELLSSAYAREREHFAVLHRGQLRELQLDILLPLSFLALLALTAVLAGTWSSTNYLYIGIGVVLYLLVPGLGVPLGKARRASLRLAMVGEEA